VLHRYTILIATPTWAKKHEKTTLFIITQVPKEKITWVLQFLHRMNSPAGGHGAV
jgi:hypothetical protein